MSTVLVLLLVLTASFFLMLVHRSNTNDAYRAAARSAENHGVLIKMADEMEKEQPFNHAGPSEPLTVWPNLWFFSTPDWMKRLQSPEAKQHVVDFNYNRRMFWLCGAAFILSTMALYLALPIS